MEKKELQNNNDVHIEQINPRTELNELEKTAIMQYKIEQKEELSKTKRFKLLNSRKKDDDLDLPKRKPSLTDTIKLKLSDLREEIDLPKLDKRKSLYDTVIIKLDDLINKKNALKSKGKKVTKVEETKKHREKTHLFKPKDITKIKNIKLNVDSEEYGRQLYNLNKIALNNLSYIKPEKVRKYSTLSKLETIDKVRVSKKNYAKYQKRLNSFAINKLYYKIAPKESKKYKVYKYSVILSGFVFLITSVLIGKWVFQGIQINNMSQSLIEDVKIETIEGGEVYNIEPPTKVESNSNTTQEKSLYWRYLNTPLSSVDFTDLSKQNKDTIGWLIVPDTNVNYPVVQAKDNDYYLTHSFDGSKNSAGWVYADFRNSFDNFSDNTVIYAHGRKDKVMFGSLTNTLDTEWYSNPDNQIIQFSTLKYNTMWQIFSIYKIQAESYYITTDFSSNEAFDNFANAMLDRSIYDFGVDIASDDKLLTLSTCYNDNGIRLVVQAKLVKIQER